MQLLISCGEVSSSQLTVLRLLNQSLDFVSDNVSRIFAPIFTNLRDFEMRLSCVERPQSSIPDNNSHSCTENFDYDQKKDPEAIFNVLDSILKSSLDRLASLRESVCQTNSFGYDDSSIMRDLCLQGKLDAALWLRRKMIQSGFIPGLFTHNHLLNGLCKLGQIEKADFLVKEMWEIGPSPNCVSYNTFIKGLCSVNNVDKALYLFSTLDRYGINPNRVTCNIIVHALCQKSGLMDTKLLEKILDSSSSSSSSSEPDLVTCTILMDRCFKNGNVVEALRLWKEMNVPAADSALYNVVIRGLCSSGNMVAAYGFLCEMIKRGVNPDVFTYNTLLSFLCKEGKFDEACNNIFTTMERVGVAPDQISYKVIIQGLCIHGDVDKANEFLLRMLEESCLLPEVQLWNLVIDGYGRYGDTSNALSVCNLMLSHGVKPNVYTYNGLIHGYVKAGRFVDAFRFKDEMRSFTKPDTTTYNLLVGAACTVGQLRLAFQLYDEMVKRGCRPDIITYTELIRGLCWKGRLEEAESLLLRLQASGVRMDHVPFWILLKKYTRWRRPEEAYLVYEKWLMTRNKRVSSSSLNRLQTEEEQ